MLKLMNPNNIPYIAGLVFVATLGMAQTDAVAQEQSPVILALWEQEGQLDQQITEFEQRIVDMRHRSTNSETLPIVVARLEPQDQGAVDDENEVSVLEEYTVQDTFLDPFDEEPAETVEDPWEGFNTSIFDFNLSFDRNFLRPVAKGYAYVMPDPLEEALGNALANIRVVPPFANNLFQGKTSEAGIVLGRFLINSTLGVAGFFDVAQSEFGIEAPAQEDAGQTLAKFGVNPGPYLVLPLLPPTTVRDGAGTLVDIALDPLTYVLPFVAQTSTRVSETVNRRAQNLDTFEGVEDSSVDLYAAVRDAYIQTRAISVQK